MLTATWTFLGLLAFVDSAMEGYIVGGKPAKILKYPHSAYIKINCTTENGNRDTWFCGGAVMNQMFILSAGHCFVDCKSSYHILISVGHVHNWKGTRYMAASFRVHAKYSPNPYINDIALVKVRRPMRLGRRVKRIAVMPDPPSFERAFVAGWGWIDEQEQTTSHYLKSVSQNLWKKQDCIDLIGSRPHAGIFCASADNETDYPSGGDSGSPLVIKNYIQVGLVSFKVPSKKEVIVYTNVSYYFEWILSNYLQMSCEIASVRENDSK